MTEEYYDCDTCRAQHRVGKRCPNSEPNKLFTAAAKVLAAQDQHGGPYPQYPELHAAIDELREVMGEPPAQETGSGLIIGRCTFFNTGD